MESSSGARRRVRRQPLRPDAAEDAVTEARLRDLAGRVAELERRLDALIAVLGAPPRAESPARRMSLDLLDQFELQHLRD